jgi:lipopolysaccharide transport system ATP-binding protein
MDDVVIRAEGLGKRYTLGTAGAHTTLRESLTNAVKAPFRAARRALGSGGAPSAAARGEFWALKDLSFEVRRGDIIGIIGRNGAGKSTLLKILSRITEPTTGLVELRGRVGSLLEVGTGFHPELTGRENIYLNGAILGMKRAEIAQKFDEIVAFAEVEQFLDTPVKHYSSGMYTRLAFAVSAHLEPEILVVDEVLAVGDAAFQKKCLGKMTQVAKAGRTVLFVSHNMAAILGLCTHGLWLDRGQKREIGPVGPVVASYARSSVGFAENDLTNIPNREGKGRIRFTRYWLESPRGRPVEQAISGEEVHIVMEYESQLPVAHHCRVGISIDSLLGHQLFVCSTELTERDEVTLGRKGVVVCTIPEFPLTSGEYAMTLFMESNREIEDVIQSGARISVADGDFFGTGRQCPIGWEGKCVIVRHRWSTGEAGPPAQKSEASAAAESDAVPVP